MNAYDRLSRRLESIAPSPSAEGQSGGPDLDVYAGLERRVPSDGYWWEGHRRGGDRRRPTLLVQYTLDGEGVYDAAGQRHRVGPGHAFTAPIPSRHAYGLPADGASSWRFFWVIVRHPYVVGRIAAAHAANGPVVRAAPESEFVVALAELFADARRGADDRFARERRLFDLIVGHDRAQHAMRHAPDERGRLLAAVAAVADHADAAGRANVDAIAAALGASRSNFNHRFRAVTGLTPAAFLRDLRLGRARDLLLRSDEPIKQIARRTGFANENHFGKAFRRRFGFTPGACRSELRPPPVGPAS